MTIQRGFVRAADGVMELEVDPASEKDYSIVWSDFLNGDTISTSTWSIAPAVSGVPYTTSINSGSVTIDGTAYAAGTVTTAWVQDLTAGVDYTVTNRIVSAAGRTDERSFRLLCREL